MKYVSRVKKLELSLDKKKEITTGVFYTRDNGKTWVDSEDIPISEEEIKQQENDIDLHVWIV